MRSTLLKVRRAIVEPELAMYPSHLGSAWSAVHPAVQCAHVRAGPVRGAGRFRIESGGSRLARVLVRLLRLPPPAEAVSTRLFVYPQGNGERWIRRFGSRFLVTTQHRPPPPRADGVQLLIERFGLLELRFTIEPESGGLRYRQVSAAFSWGSLSIPIPSVIAPIVEGWERPATGSNHTHVRVEVTAAPAGLLIRYDGTIRFRGPRA